MGILFLPPMTGAVEIIKSPDNDGDLAPHVVDIVLYFKPVPCFAEDPGKCVANYRVSDMTDMEGTIRVCTGMFEHDTDSFFCKRTISGFYRGLPGFRKICGIQ